MEGVAVRVVGDIHLVRQDFVNLYVVARGGVVLVDAGMRGVSRILSRVLEELGYGLKDVDTVVLTHHHYDHAEGLREIVEASGASVACHRDEAELVERETGVAPSLLLEDGMEVGGLRVIHTPGHTPGHIALLDSRTSALFVGDLVYEEGGRLYEMQHKYSMDPEGNRRSIKRLLDYSFTSILPSHGNPVVTGAREKLEQLVRELGL
ncbi:MAG: MBL fold metallo-hydrolase [Thermoproteota archaeon]